MWVLEIEPRSSAEPSLQTLEFVLIVQDLESVESSTLFYKYSKLHEVYFCICFLLLIFSPVRFYYRISCAFSFVNLIFTKGLLRNLACGLFIIVLCWGLCIIFFVCLCTCICVHMCKDMCPHVCGMRRLPQDHSLKLDLTDLARLVDQ